MLVVIPFCNKDEQLALKNLELCRMMDGSYSYECILSCDKNTNHERVEQAAEAVFARVHITKYDTWTGEKQWPVPQNWAWQNAARFIYSRFTQSPSWFWWEADATPVVPGWIKTLEDSHIASQKRFTGAIVSGTGHMNGVAIYPAQIVQLCPPALMVRNHPFDRMLKEATIRMVNPVNHLIQVVLEGKPTFPDQRSVKKSLVPTTVLFHGCKDGTLPDRLMEMMDPNRLSTASPNAPSNITYKHSGPYGDLVYTLAVIKAKGGGHLTVGNSDGPRVKMTKELFEIIEPLIALQPYISGVEFDPKTQVDHDLDVFRPILREDTYQFGRTILSCIAQAAGCECPPDDKAWLHVDHSIVVDGKPIVVNRTTRYRNHRFPWMKIAEKYREQCIFLGTEPEYELMKFQLEWPELKRFETRTMLDAARVVAGCKLFIGNQSSLYAVAEGLKKPVIQETFLFHADCIFNREHSTIGWDENVFLPDV